MVRGAGWRARQPTPPAPLGLLVGSLRTRVRRLTAALDAERLAHAHLVSCSDCAAPEAPATPAETCEVYDRLSAEAVRRYQTVAEEWDAGL